MRHDPLLGIIESVPVHVCRFTRAPWCVHLREVASYGKDHTDRQALYGLRLHPRLDWPGVITHLFLAPANEPNGEIAPQMLQGTHGLVLGDRRLLAAGSASCCASAGGSSCRLPSALRNAPDRSLSQSGAGTGRVLFDTGCGRLTDRCQPRRVWARDLWHVRNRLLRMVLTGRSAWEESKIGEVFSPGREYTVATCNMKQNRALNWE